tara:strand:+ start:37 stop:384 length:348 start_codon:yes stop_codon:yes gene_type:complete
MEKLPTTSSLDIVKKQFLTPIEKNFISWAYNAELTDMPQFKKILALILSRNIDRASLQTLKNQQNSLRENSSMNSELMYSEYEKAMDKYDSEIKEVENRILAVNQTITEKINQVF